MTSTTSNSEWDDIPTSSELFGGDFFGDELMEMYSADNGLIGGETAGSVITTETAPLAGATGEEDKSSHPGLLIAMNAAAMDGGLSPLGSSPEFVPMPAPSSVTTLPAYQTTVEPEPIELAPPTMELAVPMVTVPAAPQPVAVSVAAMPMPTPVTSAPVAVAVPVPAPLVAKRPVAVVAAPVQAPAKKRKAAPAVAPVPLAVTHAKMAATGGVKVVLPQAPPAPLPCTNFGRVVSQSGAGVATVIRAGVAPAPSAVVGGMVRPLQSAGAFKKSPLAPQVKSAIIPKGGINHQVVARPSVVQSSVMGGVQRIMPPAPSLSATKIIAGVKKPDISPTGVIRAKSEADFKDVASAAVSSLIQNATNTLSKTGPKPMVTGITKPGDKTVDTSTAHINALTSQNWVTACNPIPAPEPPVSNVSACDKAARNARRATLTQEERAKQNRDRNREHARNTRLRKKAYVEELKRTLTELVAQRDAADLEKRHEAQRNREQREVRFRVMEEFLKLRGRNEMNASRWVAILEDGFTFILPKTSFRHMVDTDKSSSNDVNGVPSSSSSLEQVLRGASAVMEDSQHFSTYLQTIGGPANATLVQIAYRCERKRFFMDGNIAFMDFAGNTMGAIAKGAPNEVVLKGSMRASFSPASNKLISVDIQFDTNSFLGQIEQMGSSTEAAAAVAAHEADALLDSLQMPQIFVDKKEVAVAGPVSVSSDDGEQSTDSSTALLNA